MDPCQRKRASQLLLSTFLALLAAPCFASLGQPKEVAAGATRARVMAASAPGYTVDVKTITGGTVVREYVGANGVVFAVSWSGPFLPDLRNLLGDYFGALADQSARQPKAGHSQVHVARRDIVIESTGHMRAYTGRAWVRSQLPAGFKTDDIE